MDMDKLNALGAMVDEVDAEGPPTPEQQQQQEAEAQGEQQAREWGAVVFMIGGALSMIAPELRKVYTEDACLNWGRAMNPVAEKYGWNGPSGVPELGLLIATAGLAVPTGFIVRQRLVELREGKGERSGWLAGVRDWWAARKARRAGQAQQQAQGVGDGG